MSKKDYEKFAVVFGKYYERLPENFLVEFMKELKLDNPKFDHDRFYAAVRNEDKKFWNR